MLDAGNIVKGIQAILDSELAVTEGQIKESMTRNKQVVTGRTLNSLRHETNGASGFIAGADHIDTLEKGISPERSRMSSFGHVRAKLGTWLQAKHGFQFNRGITEARWAYIAAKNQQSIGSVLFRAGGRKDVYSDKADPLVKRISERVGDYFVNVKILE